ncbi:MAG: prepilin peptidase [Thermoleophilia bacterium]|nr:prepilin peptidase [Thermoleophilia bacterium]
MLSAVPMCSSDDLLSSRPAPLPRFRQLVTFALATIVALPALAVGSFLNVVASRVPLRRSISTGRSACMSCSHEIAAYDNIPLVSWVLLRSRCRHCAASIPWRYPLVELVTAVLVVASFLRFGPTLEALLASFFCVVLVAVSAIDIEHRIVPNRIVLPAAVICLVGQTALDPRPEWVLAALGASGFLLVAALVYPGGMGMGDVKLAFLLGAMLGWTATVALMIGFLAALLPAVMLWLRYGSKARKIAIPFAPFLALGAIVALFAGGTILDAYLGFFG